MIFDVVQIKSQFYVSYTTFNDYHVSHSKLQSKNKFIQILIILYDPTAYYMQIIIIIIFYHGQLFDNNFGSGMQLLCIPIFYSDLTSGIGTWRRFKNWFLIFFFFLQQFMFHIKKLCTYINIENKILYNYLNL